MGVGSQILQHHGRFPVLGRRVVFLHESATVHHTTICEVKNPPHQHKLSACMCVQIREDFLVSLYIAHMQELPFAQTSTYILLKANHTTKCNHSIMQCFDNTAHYLHCKILNVMVKNKNINPSYLLLSPINRQLQVLTLLWSTAEHLTACC